MRTLTEAVLEAAGHVLQMAQAASAGGLTADGLLAPVVWRSQEAKYRENNSDVSQWSWYIFPLAKSHNTTQGKEGFVGRVEANQRVLPAMLQVL